MRNQQLVVPVAGLTIIRAGSNEERTMLGDTLHRSPLLSYSEAVLTLAHFREYYRSYHYGARSINYSRFDFNNSDGFGKTNERAIWQEVGFNLASAFFRL